MLEFRYEMDRHPRTGWDVARLICTQEGAAPAITQIEVAPHHGCNLFRFQVDGQDYIVGLEEDDTGVRLLGTPILYPTPNRVRNGTFTFDGRTFKFPPNNGPHFIHGLVRDQVWSLEDPEFSSTCACLTARYRFEPGKQSYDLFPIRNSLQVRLVLRPGSVEYLFSIRNEEETARLPFGLAIHPYFSLIGRRDQVRLRVPARKWMEAVDLMPTGRLVDLDEVPEHDLRKPRPLSELDLDDVYWGVVPGAAQVVYYDGIGKILTLAPSDFFTHCVVYTPRDKPFFCIENQSCATDAHNLYARGLEEAAHLTILEPGESLRARIVIRVSEM